MVLNTARHFCCCRGCCYNLESATEKYCGNHSKELLMSIEKSHITFDLTTTSPVQITTQIANMATSLHEDVTTDASIELIQSMLASGADVNVKSQKGETPLHLAVSNNNVSIVKLLLEHGASVNCENKFRQTPLHRVRWATDEAAKIVDLLVSSGVDINAEDRARETPLYLAVAHDNLSVVRALIEYGASVDCKNQLGLTPLHRALLRKNVVPDIVELLLANGAGANTESFKSETPLHSAVSHGDVAIVRKLLDRGASVDCPDRHRRTPLHLAMNSEAAAELVDLLLSSGADPNAQNSEGQTLLHLAVSHENASLVSLFLQYGALVDRKDKYQQTPLHYALTNNAAVEVVELLLTSGIDLNAKDCEGKTPLHGAVAKNDYLPIARLLIERGASVNCKDNNRRTPLHRAVVDGPREMVELLVASGADVNAKDYEGNRPLQCISERQTRYDDGELALSILLSRGALVNARNNRGESALYLALKKENKPLIDQLLKHGADVQDVKFRELIHSKSENLYRFFSWTYLIARQIANLPVCKRDNHSIFSYQYQYDKCSKEIEKLKKTFIHNRKSLYDFLHMRVSRRAAYASSEGLHRLFKWSSLEEQFPVYADIIEASNREAETRKLLSKAAEKALYVMTQTRLPDVIEHILDFLDDGDLINVIDAKDQGSVDEEEKDKL